ncbi:unnamed protein product [Urochloa humidicola]
MPGLLSKLSSAVAACARRVSRATRRLLRGRRPSRDRRQLVPAADDHQECSDDGSGGEEEGGLSQRAILMGERCKPLDFPGAIHYDSSGRRLTAAPAPLPRGGKAAAGRGALLCRSARDVDEDALAYRRAT